MASDRPIFVMGCARSGTTMLQLMLHAHPRIAIPPETRFVLTGYQRRTDFGDLRKVANRRLLATWIVHSPETAFRDLGLPPDEVIEEIVAGPPSLGSAMGIVFRAYSRKFGKPRWGDKRPAYLANLHIMLRLFPDAQIINIIRDGRDCVSSLTEVPWARNDIYHAISGWARAIDVGRWAARRLPAQTYYEVRYERLVADPEPELTALCDFLGEEFDPAMTEPAKLAPTAVPGRKTWHALTHSAVTTSRVGSWAHRLEPWELALCETVLGRRLRAAGYPPSGTAGRPGAEHLLRYAPVAARRRLVAVKHAADRAYHRYRPPAQVAALLTAAQVAAQPRNAWPSPR